MLAGRTRYMGIGNTYKDDIINKISNALKELFKGSSYEILTKVPFTWDASGNIYNQTGEYSIVILNKFRKVPVLILEIKKDWPFLLEEKELFLNEVKYTNSNFAVITNGDIFEIYNYSTHYSEDVLWLENFLNWVRVNVLYFKPKGSGYANEIKLLIEKYYNELAEYESGEAENKSQINKTVFEESKSLFLDLKNWISKITDKDIIVNNFEFKFKPEIEKQFFDIIIPKCNVSTLNRYSSFRSLWRILDNQTFYMSGISSLNDNSECFFLETVLNGEKQICLDDKKIEDLEELNSYFISSFCPQSQNDKLTMWRLYGDDGKGVCLQFKVMEEKLNSIFELRSVKYVNSDDPVISFLKELTRINKNNIRFKFSEITKWQHFFKPDIFSVEQEIRLLYRNEDPKNSKFILNETYGIIMALKEFKMEKSEIEFPLKLEKIILGPKFVENDINKAQLRYLLKIHNLEDTKIEFSQIMHYR